MITDINGIVLMIMINWKESHCLFLEPKSKINDKCFKCGKKYKEMSHKLI